MFNTNISHKMYNAIFGHSKINIPFNTQRNQKKVQKTEQYVHLFCIFIKFLIKKRVHHEEQSNLSRMGGFLFSI